MLGHTSAAMTIDTYSGILEDDLDAVAQALNAAGGSHSRPTTGNLPRCGLYVGGTVERQNKKPPA